MATLISIQELRDWCRIDGSADDDVLYALILSAQELASQYTGLTLDAATCPEAIKRAVAVFAADLYANREGQIVGRQTFEWLLDPFRASII